MPDDLVGEFGFVFVLLHKFFGAREGYLCNVFFDFLAGHPDAAVADGERSFFAVNFYFDAGIAGFAFEFAEGGKGFQFLGCVNCVRNQFAQKNLMIGVKKLFDNGENVLRLYVNFTGSHSAEIVVILSLLVCFVEIGTAEGQSPCQLPVYKDWLTKWRGFR